MSREKYLLFVDEVKPTDQFYIYNFTGITIKESNYDSFVNQLNNIKDNSLARLGGRKVNIHFVPLIGRRKNSAFETLSVFEEQSLWTDLFNLFENTEYHILSGAIHNRNYLSHYNNYRVKIENLAFKVLLQNFVRFLQIRNGSGEIIVESSCDDEKLQEEYYRTKFSGSKYITTDGYNAVLRGIKFEKKERLIEGLQFVDCIANPVSRHICGIRQFQVKGVPHINFTNLIVSKAFDGNGQNIYEYGIRKIFC